MKTVEISQLWETGREILTWSNSEFERPQTLADLKECKEVLLGDKIPQTKIREAIIGNIFCLLEPTTVRHPMGGTMYVIEVH